ncbi:MAG: LacI family DNA-binding transcriptional regulator [Devosia sp.]
MKKRETSQRVTIRTVAADAGVSVATASKVLRDAYGVSQSAKERVRASMSKLSYRPHAAARGMRGQTYTLGVLLPDLHNPFFDEIMKGVHSFLAVTPYQALLGFGQSEIDQEFALVHNMIDRQMDGLLMVAPRLTGKQIEDVAGQAPTVLIGLHEPKATNYDTVNNDDFESGRLAVHHLHEGGRRRIVFFSLALPPSIEESTIVVHRERGYRTAMNELKLARFSRVVFAGQDRGSIRDQALHLLRSKTRPEAIFCWTDFVAFEVMSVARELGLVVPGDVAIMGHDNTAFCDLSIASLTSIDQSGPLLGENSARLLIERIEGRTKSEFLTVVPKIVARGSTKIS